MTKSVAALDEIAKKFGGNRVGYDGKEQERTWYFSHSNPCTSFARAAEAAGFQMWASANLAGLLLPSDPMWRDGTRISCVDGKPVKRT